MIDKNFGVFTHRGDGRYTQSKPIKVYKTKKPAQAFCDRDYEAGNAGNYVVRETYHPTDALLAARKRAGALVAEMGLLVEHCEVCGSPRSAENFIMECGDRLMRCNPCYWRHENAIKERITE